MRGFLGDERGSARLALAIALVAIAVLAAAAVPMVFSQVDSGRDTRAQSAVTELAREVETCRLAASSYRDCDEPPELKSTGGRWGRDAGDSGLIPRQSTPATFVAYAVSGGGGRIYVLSSHDSQRDKRVCDHASVERLERGDCTGPGW